MNKNIEMIQVIASGLGDLKDSVVFVGGATASLYFETEDLSVIRPTEDVDCIIEISSTASYTLLTEKLIAMRFYPDATVGAPICRFKYAGVKVDVMPTDEESLGFTNQWYEESFETKQKYTLPDGQDIFILSLPYFFATKIVAFKSRGADEPRFSHDLEDIVTLLASVEKADILGNASTEAQTFIKEEFKAFTEDEEILEAIHGQNPYPGLAGSIDKIMENLRL